MQRAPHDTERKIEIEINIPSEMFRIKDNSIMAYYFNI